MNNAGHNVIRPRGAVRAMPPAEWSAPGGGALVTAFWVMVAVFTLFLAFAFIEDPSWRVLGSAFVMAAAMLPAYLWCRKRALGVPIFPLFAFTFVWTYAYPLASDHPIVLSYSDEAGLFAAATVGVFLLLATLTWFLVSISPNRPVYTVRSMAAAKGAHFFSTIIFLAGLFTLSLVGGWLAMPASVFSVVRAALFGLSSVGIFVLAYRWGRRGLSESERAWYSFALAIYLVSQSMTLFLVGAIVASLLATIAFAVGRRQLPWRSALVMLLLFSRYLHLGKSEMRSQYWYPAPQAVQLWDFPAFMLQWLGEGVKKTMTPSEEVEMQPLFERLSLVHLLLKVQQESPERIPYLEGRTYSVIPGLLVPRALDPDKLAAHEGTRMLNIHYGLQSPEEVEDTTIGWGLVNEAAANFGLVGVMVLAVLLGALYGWITKFAMGMPVLSLRTLVAVTFLAFAAQTEFTAGVYVSALFQSLVVLFAMSFVMMSERALHDGD